MHLTFSYNPRMEVVTLRAGTTPTYSTQPTQFALEAQAAGIDITSPDTVAEFCQAKISSERIPVDQFIREFQEAWNPVQPRANQVFQELFATDWDSGEVTAYLTLSTRCPYSTTGKYFFVSMVKQPPTPVATSLHELMHFYAHSKLEQIFLAANKGELFGDFKEALTILLNSEFSEVMEQEDQGYPQHQELRAWIREAFAHERNLRVLTHRYVES